MVGPRDYDIEVGDFAWNYSEGGNVDHMAEHGVRPSDVIEVHAGAPRYFRNIRRDGASHIMIGPNRSGRYLRAAIVKLREPDTWLVVTAHWLSSRRGERMYASE